MRGLILFIKDLENCKGKEEESKRINKEIANIRSKFKSNSLKGYDKKKYVSKLIFMYLLGYRYNFGYANAINLISSNAYSEKQIGYLFISIVMGKNYNVMPLIINRIKNDLSSPNALFQNLALQFVANNTSVDLALSLAEVVLGILLSRHTVEYVKQTAALTLLQLLRTKPNLTFENFKANRIIDLISHQHLGIVTASMSLIDFLFRNTASQFQSCLHQCVIKLNAIVTAPCTAFPDYTYSNIVAPWLIVKLLRILRNFRAPTEAPLKSRLLEALNIILNKASNPIKQESTNAKYAIIFEAISLIIQMDLDCSIQCKAIIILGLTLKSKKPNIRLMAMDKMTQLSKLPNNEMCLTNVKKQWESVLDVLKTETDTTIKNQAVDLLYNICDRDNAKPIVDEMLHYLVYENNYSVDVILKVASLTEKFGSNLQWYVDTVLNMIRTCGDIVDESMWYTLIKVIRENDVIQEYAVRASYAVLNEKPCYDSMIKVAGYILGEFGHLIAGDPATSHVKQLSILREKYSICSQPTRAILLTTYMKFLSMYPDLKDEIQSILKEKCSSQWENEEIQQRAVECLKLSETASKTLLATVFEGLSSCTRHECSILPAVKKQSATKFDIQHVEKNVSKETSGHCRSHFNLSFTSEPLHSEGIRIKSVSLSDLRDASATPTNLDTFLNIFKKSSHSDTVSKVYCTPQISNFLSNETFLHHLLFNETGVLFENCMIKIYIECKFKKHFGRFDLKYINKSTCPLSDFTVKGNFDSIEHKCLVWFTPITCMLRVGGTLEQDIILECLKEFSEKSCINLKFTCEREQYEVQLILPLTLNKFIKPSSMSEETFNKRWQDLELTGQEVNQEFTTKYPMIYGFTNLKLKGFRVYVMQQTDSDSKVNFNCAGVLYTREQQMGFLIRLDQSLELKKYCLSVRSNQHNLSQAISDLLLQLL